MNSEDFKKFLFSKALKAGLAVNEIFPRESEYKRDFKGSELEAAKIKQPDDYIRFVEFENEEEEQEIFNDLKKSFANDVPDGEGATAEDGVYQDPHWGHTTGFFAGKLSIKADKLNKDFKDFRVGLFAQDRDYDVVIRPNFLFDNEPSIEISRLSIKIKYPEAVPNEYIGQAHELDLLLSEGLPLSSKDQDGQGFFFRDAKQMQLLLELAKRKGLGKISMAAHGGHGSVLKSWRNDTYQENVDQLYENDQRRRGWAGKYFYSAGPYALDDATMKFCLEPHQKHQLGKLIKLGDPTQGEIRRASNWPSDAGEEIAFTLKVQIATAASITAPNGTGHPPKEVMAAEYTDLAWDDTLAPFESVGTLTIHHSPPEHWRDIDHWAHLPMNAWNTFECMRPLGQLFRARRVVHSHHRKARLSKSYKDVTGGAWTCPFSGALKGGKA